MERKDYLDCLLTEEGFLFKTLILEDIDNQPVIKINKPDIVEQETCLFHRDVSSGDEYLSLLHNAVGLGIKERRSLPVVRFADGEYAFYSKNLDCNGLYQQAEDVAAIEKAMPFHKNAMKTLSLRGILSPLIFPGNTRKRPSGFWSFLRRARGNGGARDFLDFLCGNGVALTARNYIPFYAVYAYLTSADFARQVQDKKLCILGSEFHPDALHRWFEEFGPCPEIVFQDIPSSYVATRWEDLRDEVMKKIPAGIDICLVGAGVGALLVCVDVAERFSIPVIDAGHVLNMMNGREDKSQGPRLYTIRHELHRHHR